MDESAGGRPRRLVFADNLRTALVVLVVLHHIALVYGGVAPFYYTEPPPYGSPAFPILLVFVLVNQAWFMGALFLLSGYFAPGSCDRRGPVRFLKERLWRLGVPLLVFYFVLNPLSSMGLYLMPAQPGGAAPPLTWDTYSEIVGLGPMWFVLLLIVFDFGYALWPRPFPKGALASPLYCSAGARCLIAIAGVIALATCSFLVRIQIPIGQAVLGFPTLSYFPQYLAFFLIGIAASRKDSFRKLSLNTGLGGLGLAAAATVILFPLAFSGRFFSLQLTPRLNLALGSGHWQSAVYALWDSIFAVGLCLGLIALFRRFLDRPGSIGDLLSRLSFTVYVVHIPVIVLLAWCLRSVELAPLTKFGLACCIMVPAGFAVAFLIGQLGPRLHPIR